MPESSPPMEKAAHELPTDSLHTTTSANWFTAKRMLAHGAILAACLWSVYIWNLSTPGLLDRNGNLKGTDFLHFYTLGSLAVRHEGAELYDMNAQAALAAELVPEAAGKRYLPLYPPQVSILFAPFASLPYGWAFLLWTCCSAALYAICCYLIWRACPSLRPHGITVFLLAPAYPAFFHLIAWGQTSALALVSFTLMFFLLRERHRFLAGIALGLLIFKPQLGLAAAVVFLLIGEWRLVTGAVLSALAELSIGIAYYGLTPLREWLHMLRNTGSVLPWLEPRPYQTHSLRTFWSMLLPWSDVAFGLYVVSAAVVLALAVSLWRKNDSPLALRYSSLLLATVLVAPHLTVYDLVVLAPALLLATDWLIGKKSSARGPLAILLYLVYILPLLSPLLRWTHLQLSVIAMTACVYEIWRASRYANTETASQVLAGG